MRSVFQIGGQNQFEVGDRFMIDILPRDNIPRIILNGEDRVPMLPGPYSVIKEYGI